MSTKTTFKRIALVTVAALGFGVLATVPSQATVSAHSLTLASTSATQLTSETVTAGAGVATVSFLNSGLGDTVSVTAYLMSAPAGNTATPYMLVSETSSAYVDTVALFSGTQKTSAYADVITGQIAYITPSTATPSAVTAKLKVFMNGPTKAGTYTVKLVPAVISGGGVIDTTGVTVTITVGQNPATDTVATSATSILNTGETASAITDATVTFPKGTSAEVAVSSRAAAATIKVTLKNAAAASTTSESYTATIDGAGILGSGANTGTTITSGDPVGRAITVKAGDVVQVFNDGSSGVGTVTIKSALGLVLATEKVTFYGAAATITASIFDNTIALPALNSGFISIVIADAAGTAVTTGTFYVVSDATTIVSNSYTTCSSYDATYGWLCSITGVKAGTANLTITSNTSATDTTGVSSAKVAVRVGTTTPSKVVVAFDKATYAPGEKAKITLTLTDADGKNVPSGVYTGILKTGGLVSSYALGTASDSMTDTALRYVVDGVQTYTVFMPLNSTAVTVTGTTGTTTAAANAGLATANQAAAISIVGTIVNTVSDAAQAAAEEATAAANDATDAALSAAEAAEAATAMAQEAVDAVAELSAQVTSLISALRAQITALTNLVVKIQKKVKA
ncbi:hypothetical protein MCEGKSE7_00054 [Candidatus Nanopelagicaceae bacterium]